VSALRSIVIAGGGTGGHVYPGVAIAEEVLRRNPDARVLFIGTARGLEGRILETVGYPLATISASRLKGGGLWSKVKGLFRLPVGMFQSWRILRRAKPDVVIGVGGYASGPALLAAWMSFRKTAIQEQNATPGLTNRWLGKLVKRVFVGFTAAGGHFKATKVVATGNPIRRAIAERLAATARGPINDAPADVPALRVLVFGGSQGAAFLNEHVPELLLRVVGRGVAVTVLHQTGPDAVDATVERYELLGNHARIVPFIDQMAVAYGEADLAICRAGALTIAEITAVGLPSVLVPFPHAADNHQEANARVLEAAGAAIVAPQTSWDAVALAERIAGLAKAPEKLGAMGAAARTLAKVDAARAVVDGLEELAA
jgi:UDP-N-acetylglucosamine--N-acetylmuramyl-(pentapeptide) pyrophosphoryl-undecaprenol N-acetylglucosamine transferase